MLSGKYKHTIDAKGRVIVPIRFREDLGDTFIVTRGLDECLALYSMQEWYGLEEKIKQLPMARSRQIQRYLFSNAFPVELDEQGRIVLPADLRDFAGLKKEVIIAGVSTRAEIWDSAKWAESETLSSTGNITEMMMELGF